MLLVSDVVPFVYTHRYNRKGLEGIAYIFEYYIALLLYILLVSPTFTSVLVFIFSLTAFVLTYEMGYMENNILAISREDAPTIRHTPGELASFRGKLKQIFFFRYLMISVLLYVLSLYLSVWPIVLLLIMTRVLFHLYNLYFRQGLSNRALFATLRFLRFYTPISYLGLGPLLLVLPIVIVNIINNYAWYDRTSVHLPRLFGTKLFDSFAYLIFYSLFIGIDHYNIAYVFLYLSVIKILLFFIVLSQRKNTKSTNKKRL